MIENEDVELYGPDIAWVISYVVKDYNSYRDRQQYISKDIKDAASLIHEYVPQWPTRDALDKGLVHQNQEVQKISKWILHIQQNGSDDVGHDASFPQNRFIPSAISVPHALVPHRRHLGTHRINQLAVLIKKTDRGLIDPVCHFRTDRRGQ